MKRNMLMVLAIISGLSMTPVLAGSSGEAAPGSTPGGTEGVSAGAQIGENTGAMVGGEEGGPSGAAAKENKKTLGDVGSTRGAAASKAKPAGTGTAVGYIYDQVQKGNIKIEGATDADFDE